MYQVIQPPEDEAKLAEVGKELFAAAKALGMNLEPEGFLQAWVTGTRVVVERDAEQKITGMLLMAVGIQWTQNEVTASVLESRGDRAGLVEFAKQMAAAMGAKRLFVEVEDWMPQVVGQVVEVLTQHKLMPSVDETTQAIDKVFKLHYPTQKLKGVVEFTLQ